MTPEERSLNLSPEIGSTTRRGSPATQRMIRAGALRFNSAVGRAGLLPECGGSNSASAEPGHENGGQHDRRNIFQQSAES